MGSVFAACALVWSTTGPVAATDAIYGLCAFPITHEFTFHGGTFQELPTDHSSFSEFATGQVIAKITNVDTGAFVFANGSSATFFYSEGTIAFRGPSTWFKQTPIEVAGVVPGIYEVVGNVRVTVDDQGLIQTISGAIFTRDICAELTQ